MYTVRDYPKFEKAFEVDEAEPTTLGRVHNSVVDVTISRNHAKLFVDKNGGLSCQCVGKRPLTVRTNINSHKPYLIMPGQTACCLPSGATLTVESDSLDKPVTKRRRLGWHVHKNNGSDVPVVNSSITPSRDFEDEESEAAHAQNIGKLKVYPEHQKPSLRPTAHYGALPAQVKDEEDVIRFLVEVLGDDRVTKGIMSNVEDEEIDGPAFLSLSENELKDVLGITKFGQRRKVYLALQEYKENAKPKPVKVLDMGETPIRRLDDGNCRDLKTSPEALSNKPDQTDNPNINPDQRHKAKVPIDSVHDGNRGHVDLLDAIGPI